MGKYQTSYKLKSKFRHTYTLIGYIQIYSDLDLFTKTTTENTSAVSSLKKKIQKLGGIFSYLCI